MKTLILTTMALLSYCFIHAQETPVELEDVTVSAKNSKFLRVMQDEYTPSHAAELHSQVANFDFVPGEEYRGSGKDDYFVEFRSDHGSMYTTFDANGQITRCKEKYWEIRLPGLIRERVFKDHQGWSLDGSQYTAIYKDEKVSKRAYKVKLKKGANKKVVTIDLDDH